MRLVLSGWTSTITHRNTAISASAKTAWRREGQRGGGEERGRGRGGAGEGRGRQRREKSAEERRQERKGGGK